jgi:hypothetical protein
MAIPIVFSEALGAQQSRTWLSSRLRRNIVVYDDRGISWRWSGCRFLTHNRPFVNDGTVFDNTFTSPFFPFGKDFIGNCHSNSKSDAASNTARMSESNE